MIMAFEQMEWLEKGPDSELYHFIGQDKASKADRERLKKLDAENVEVYGVHLIDNYKEL